MALQRADGGRRDIATCKQQCPRKEWTRGKKMIVQIGKETLTPNWGLLTSASGAYLLSLLHVTASVRTPPMADSSTATDSRRGADVEVSGRQSTDQGITCFRGTPGCPKSPSSTRATRATRRAIPSSNAGVTVFQSQARAGAGESPGEAVHAGWVRFHQSCIG